MELIDNFYKNNKMRMWLKQVICILRTEIYTPLIEIVKDNAPFITTSVIRWWRVGQ